MSVLLDSNIVVYPAAAVEPGCERFLTQDLRLAGLPDIAIDALS